MENQSNEIKNSIQIENDQDFTTNQREKQMQDKQKGKEEENQDKKQMPKNLDNANILELANMFPQIQPSILEAVLVSHQDDLQACIPDLLEMSDPTFTPSVQESMVRADELLARQLSLNENERMDDQSLSNSQQQPQFLNLPYKPRIKRNTSQTNRQNQSINSSRYQQDHQPNSQFPPQNDSPAKDEIQKIAEEIGKLAETGKKTMSLWFNKAIAKVQEIQTTATTASNQSGSGNLQDPYETIQRPNSSPSHSKSSISTLPNTTTSPTQNNRNTSNLPYGSRYHPTSNINTNRAHPSSSPSLIASDSTSFLQGGGASSTSRQHPGPASSSSGYKIDQAHSDQTLLNEKRGLEGNSKEMNHSSPSTHKPDDFVHHNFTTHSKVKDDDDESLEYTRNPFEDDD